MGLGRLAIKKDRHLQTNNIKLVIEKANISEFQTGDIWRLPTCLLASEIPDVVNSEWLMEEPSSNICSVRYYT